MGKPNAASQADFRLLMAIYWLGKVAASRNDL
jgi:hypothetical protein